MSGQRRREPWSALNHARRALTPALSDEASVALLLAAVPDDVLLARIARNRLDAATRGPDEQDVLDPATAALDAQFDPLYAQQLAALRLQGML